MDIEESKDSSLKISMASITSNPIADRDIFGKENKELYKIICIFIIADFILNELIIINDCNFLSKFSNKEEKPSIGLFFCFTIISIFIFGGLLLLLYLKKLILSKIARFFYFTVGILYYMFQVTVKLLFFAKNGFSLKPFDIIIFIIISLTIIPRIIGFLYIKVYERTIVKLDKAKVTEEQEKFLEKVVNKFDRSASYNSKEKEMEKELDRTVGEDEEIILTMNNNKVITDKKKNDNNNKENQNKKKSNTKEEEVEEEEVADLS